MHLLKQLSLGLICITTSPVFSADLYYGFRFGITQFDTDIDNVTGSARLEENDVGFKILAGMPLGDFISSNTAIEVFYTNYGEATLGGHAGDSFTLDGSTFNFVNNDSELSTGVTTFGLNGVYNYSLSQSRTLIAKLGIIRWENDLKIQSPFTSISSSENDLDVYWNLGFEQKLGKSLSLIVDYEAVETEDVNLSSVAVAVTVKF